MESLSRKNYWLIQALIPRCPSFIQSSPTSPAETQIEAIAHDEAARGWLSGFDALNIRSENQLPSEASSSRSQLGIKSLLDLRSCFRNYDIVPSCEFCNEAGVKADLCPNEGCAVRIHKYCLKNLLSQRGDKVCSGCGETWPCGRITKERAVDDEEEENDSLATTLRSKKRKHRGYRDSPENISSQASSTGATRRRVTRSPARLS